jgi:hypothetical protein
LRTITSKRYHTGLQAFRCASYRRNGTAPRLFHLPGTHAIVLEVVFELAQAERFHQR